MDRRTRECELLAVEPRYEVTRYDGKEVSMQAVDAAEVASFDFASADHLQAQCLGLLEFASDDGTRTRYEGKWPGLGPVALRVLHAIQLDPGIFLTPFDIAGLTGHRTLAYSPALAARIMKLREAHREKGRKPWFIETKTAGGYGVRWPKERTWIWIERIPLVLNGD